eukprot:7152161-Pyramimonas_sp.AAC.1
MTLQDQALGSADRVGHGCPLRSRGGEGGAQHGQRPNGDAPCRAAQAGENRRRVDHHATQQR